MAYSHVLVVRPKKVQEPEEEQDPWEIPELLITTPAEEAPKPAIQSEQPDRTRSIRREDKPAAEQGKARQGRRQRYGNRPKGERSAAEARTEAQQGRKGNRPKTPRPKADGQTPQEQSQKARSKNYYGRRRPYNRRPRNEGGSQPKGEG